MNALPVYRRFLEKHSLAVPDYHVVLGSGYGTALEKFPWEKVGDLSFADLPGFHASTVPDHAGCYRFYKKGKHVLCFQMGRLHGYEGHAPALVTQTVMVPRLAGVKNFVLTNAAGGLSLAMRPGDVMLIRDHVNLTGMNPLVGGNPKGLDGKELGPRFPDLARLYDREWRARLGTHFQNEDLGVHEGVYLGLLGPSFETPAEVQLFSSWGLHAVGMSTVWEAIALGHSGARVCGITLVSNMGAGLGEGPIDHLKVLETCRGSAAKIVNGLRACLEEELG
ncbi:MAG TPA: purine-nucleoside phosphorylase [Bdellovibrionota bacterium]|jgi:purine-nucleoside phosphorylase